MSAVGFQYQGNRVPTHAVAVALMCLKLSRISGNPNHRDSWVDMAGYSACGWDCASYEPYEDDIAVIGDSR